MHRPQWMRNWAMAAVLAMAAGCGEQQDSAVTDMPANLTRNAACMLDGMILMDYPGPKGQVYFKDGEVHYFCDTRDLIETLHDPDYKNKIRSAFVQDFGGRDWGSYADRWIDLTQAFLVLDSNKNGAMGPTIATFAQRVDAEAFAAANGGTVLPYGELDEARFNDYQRRVREQLRDIAKGAGMDSGKTPSGGQPHGHD